MVLKGAPDRYGLVAIALHWSSAPIIIVLLVVGIAAANVTDPAVSTRLLRIHATARCPSLGINDREDRLAVGGRAARTTR